MRNNLRLKLSNVGANKEEDIYKIAGKLLELDDKKIDEILTLIISFKNFFIKAEKLDISILIQQRFHVFLIYILKQQINEKISENALSCLIYWYEKYQETCSFIFSNEIANLLTLFIVDSEASVRLRILSINLLQRICYSSYPIVKFLLDNSIITKYMEIYKSESNVALKNEILKNLYFILHSEPHPDFQEISQVSDLFIGMLKNIDDPSLHYLLTVSSAFIECGSPCAFVFTEIVSIDLIFQQFSNLSIDSQFSILYIFMHIQLK